MTDYELCVQAGLKGELVLLRAQDYSAACVAALRVVPGGRILDGFAVSDCPRGDQDRAEGVFASSGVVYEGGCMVVCGRRGVRVR